MFTGIVKLAQIDDYINPSQNCIQPKIMKEGEKIQKATVSLNDCLACSGCITSAESVLIEQMSVEKLIKELSESAERDVIVILAPQVILSMARHYQQQPEIIFAILSNFFKEHFKVKLVLDLWEGIVLGHELIYREYSQKKEKTLLCSQCPGWICYAQKTLTQEIIKLMSNVKSPQQILARLIKQQMKKCLVVSVMPCYDKKLEAIRFNIEEDIKQLDITITTTQLIDLYKTVLGSDQTLFKQQTSLIFEIDRFFPENKKVPYGFLTDQASNGYVESLISRLRGQDIKKVQIKNSDFIQYEFVENGKTVKMAKCYGFRNIQKIVQAVKRNKCQYAYVQIMACPGGCFSGGGQIKVENIKSKEITASFNALTTKSIINKEDFAIDLSQVPSREGFTAKYRAIEKTLTQSVMSW